jgi:hypothetical protein
MDRGEARAPGSLLLPEEPALALLPPPDWLLLLLAEAALEKSSAAPARLARSWASAASCISVACLARGMNSTTSRL